MTVCLNQAKRFPRYCNLKLAKKTWKIFIWSPFIQLILDYPPSIEVILLWKPIILTTSISLAVWDGEIRIWEKRWRKRDFSKIVWSRIWSRTTRSGRWVKFCFFMGDIQCLVWEAHSKVDSLLCLCLIIYDAPQLSKAICKYCRYVNTCTHHTSLSRAGSSRIVGWD